MFDLPELIARMRKGRKKAQQAQQNAGFPCLWRVLRLVAASFQQPTPGLKQPGKAASSYPKATSMRHQSHLKAC